MSKELPCAKVHADPVHLNRKDGHIWICLQCGQQIAGKEIPYDELEACFLLIESLRDKWKKEEKKCPPPKK